MPTALNVLRGSRKKKGHDGPTNGVLHLWRAAHGYAGGTAPAERGVPEITELAF